MVNSLAGKVAQVQTGGSLPPQDPQSGSWLAALAINGERCSAEVTDGSRLLQMMVQGDFLLRRKKLLLSTGHISF